MISLKTTSGRKRWWRFSRCENPRHVQRRNDEPISSTDKTQLHCRTTPRVLDCGGRAQRRHRFRALLRQPIALLALALTILTGCNGCNKSKPPSGTGGTNAVAPLPATGIDPIRGHLLQAQPKLPSIKIWVGAEELEAEIAHTRLQIATGMMFRTNMPENTAMLFVFGAPEPKNFYMRNCVVPLSAGYIEPDGTLAEIAKLDPGDEVGVPSKSSNIQFVLEVPQGWFERHNIKPGAVIRTEQGPLQEMFSRKR